MSTHAPNAWRGPRIALPVGLALAFAAFEAWLQHGATRFAGIDSFFHIAYARLLREVGFVADFPWLSATFFRDHWVDHQFLYHVLLVPFAGDDLAAGGAASSVFFAGAVGAALGAVLQRLGPRAGAAGAVLVMGSGSLLFWRLSMVRTQGLALALLLLAFLALNRGRPLVCAVVGYLFALSYQAAVLLLGAAVAWMVACRALGRGGEAYGPGVRGLLLGTLLGFVLNPYFPDSLGFLVAHVGYKLMNPHAIAVGSEWTPAPLRILAAGAPVPLLALPVALAAGLAAWRSGRLQPLSFALLGSSLVFLALTLRAVKFAEYFAPFALLSTACALHDLWPDRRRALCGCAAAGLAGLAWTAVDLPQNLANLPPVDRWAGAARWLRENVPADEIVFHFAWEEFPELFYYDRTHRYIVGLDPNFMDWWSREHSETYARLASGTQPDPVGTIRELFGARWVFVGLALPKAHAALGRDPRARIVYRDENAAVIELGDASNPAAPTPRADASRAGDRVDGHPGEPGR